VIDAGTLRHVATFLSPPPAGGTQDSFGRPVGAFTVQFTTRASIEDLSGRELLVAQQLQADVTHKVRARWRPGVKASWRVQVTRGGVTQTFELAEPPRDTDGGVRVAMEFFAREVIPG